jgi:hypothetical protein
MGNQSSRIHAAPRQVERRRQRGRSPPLALTVAGSIALPTVAAIAATTGVIATREATADRLAPPTRATAAPLVPVVVVVTVPPWLLSDHDVSLDALGAIPHGALAIEKPPTPSAPGRHRGVLREHVLHDIEVDNAPPLQAPTTTLWHTWDAGRPWQGYPAHVRHQGRLLDPRPQAESLGVLSALAAVFDVVQRARPPDDLLRRRVCPSIQRQTFDAQAHMLAESYLLSAILQAPWTKGMII